MITDYDCWKVDEAHVTVEMVVANLMKNAATAKAILAAAIPQIPAEPNWPCHGAPQKRHHDRPQGLAAEDHRGIETDSGEISLSFRALIWSRSCGPATRSSSIC